MKRVSITVLTVLMVISALTFSSFASVSEDSWWSGLQGFGENMLSGTRGFFEGIGSDMVSGFNNVKNWLLDIANVIKKGFQSLLDGIADFFIM